MGRETQRQKAKGKEVIKMAKVKKPMVKLANKRNEKGYTQEELAFLCGLKSDTISQYERGIRNPNLTTISEIARVLKCSVSDLV